MDKKELDNLSTPEELYEWMEQNMAYGWVGVDGTEHINEMKDFRRDYRTMGIEEIVKRKMGTCIEQVSLMHTVLDHMGVENTMYCCRIFEPDDYGNLEEEEHMHCFLLYFQNGKVYHLEHPNGQMKGIYEYDTKENAIDAIVAYYVKMRGGKESPTTEFDRVPEGSTFREFNAYINSCQK